jgi:hypothetical protein
MPTQAPTYAPPLVVTLPATSVDNPSGSATLNGYMTFPPGTPVTYHYEYFSSDPLNPVLSPNVTVTAAGVVQTVQVGDGWYRDFPAAALEEEGARVVKGGSI